MPGGLIDIFIILANSPEASLQVYAQIKLLSLTRELFLSYSVLFLYIHTCILSDWMTIKHMELPYFIEGNRGKHANRQV